MKRQRKQKFWFIAVALLTLLTIWGCARHNPLGPEYQYPGLVERDNPTSAAISPEKQLEGESTETDLNLSRVDYVGPRIYRLLGLLGGTIVIPCNGYYSYYYVPASALEVNLTISVQATQGCNSRGNRITEYDFWPDGLIFEKTTYLDHRTSAKDGSLAQLWWYNPDNGAWELIKQDKIRNGKCTFSIDHFSKYRVYEGSVSASGQ